MVSEKVTDQVICSLRQNVATIREPIVDQLVSFPFKLTLPKSLPGSFVLVSTQDMSSSGDSFSFYTTYTLTAELKSREQQVLWSSILPFSSGNDEQDPHRQEELKIALPLMSLFDFAPCVFNQHFVCYYTLKVTLYLSSNVTLEEQIAPLQLNLPVSCVLPQAAALQKHAIASRPRWLNSCKPLNQGNLIDPGQAYLSTSLIGQMNVLNQCPGF
ncbi:hypothetical protein Ciccas_009932 [Cichlidogyrus casuarinus]|uniref:Arrestin-like N-terminal domain-containing protein n=1 Tax=Cichlidogyrus casuarinus TaxID=1844966 RepID=A0ABD2PWM4_9PLAT